MEGLFKHLQITLEDEIDLMQHKIVNVNSKTGNKVSLLQFKDCLTIWEGLPFLQQGMGELADSVSYLPLQLTKDTEHLTDQTTAH
jgi:hypothetical protein